MNDEKQKKGFGITTVLVEQELESAIEKEIEILSKMVDERKKQLDDINDRIRDLQGYKSVTNVLKKHEFRIEKLPK